MPVLPGDIMLDCDMDYDSIAKAGSMLGSGAVIIMDDTRCMVKSLLRLELVEHLAKIALVAAQLGGARPIPATDVQTLLAQRDDIFPDYDKDNFARILGSKARIVKQVDVLPTRTLFWFDRG